MNGLPIISKFSDIERHSYCNGNYPEYLVNKHGQYFDVPPTAYKLKELIESEGDLWLETRYDMAQTAYQGSLTVDQFEYC